MATLSDMTPARGAIAITPHNTNVLTPVTRALYVGGAGNIKVEMSNGTVVTFTGVLAGSLLPIRVRIVFDDDTTATAMIGLY